MWRLPDKFGISNAAESAVKASTPADMIAVNGDLAQSFKLLEYPVMVFVGR